MERPPNRPTCKHGNRPGYCGKCQEERKVIAEKIAPLVDAFWENRGRRDMEGYVVRAFRMGEDHRTERVKALETALGDALSCFREDGQEGFIAGERIEAWQEILGS